MNKKYFWMNFIFFDVIVAGAICGYMAQRYCIGSGWEVFAGAALTLLSMFTGMVLAFMVSDDRERPKRMRMEQNNQLQLQQVVLQERTTCAKVSVNMAKVMADRVSNKIVAKYVDGMNDESRRRAVLANINGIIDDEVDTLTKALFNEINKEKES
jgi:hypothetical protein